MDNQPNLKTLENSKTMWIVSQNRINVEEQEEGTTAQTAVLLVCGKNTHEWLQVCEDTLRQSLHS